MKMKAMLFTLALLTVASGAMAQRFFDASCAVYNANLIYDENPEARLAILLCSDDDLHCRPVGWAPVANTARQGFTFVAVADYPPNLNPEYYKWVIYDELTEEELWVAHKISVYRPRISHDFGDIPHDWIDRGIKSGDDLEPATWGALKSTYR